MKEKIFNIVRTATFYQTGFVTAATITNGFLGLVFYWLLARFFDPATLGFYVVFATAAGLVSDVFTIGTDTGVVNFVGKYIKSDKEKAFRFLKIALETKVIVSILVLVIGWFLVPVVAVNFLGKPELTSALRFALVGATAWLFFGFSSSGLQSLQKFFEWGALNIFSNLGRLILVYLLFLIGILNINSTIIVYIAFPFVAFLFSFLLLPNFLLVKNESQVAREFFHYNKWVAIFTMIAAVSSRLDVFLVTRLLPLASVGIYSVALTLSSVVPQIVGAVGTVVAPKLAGLDTKEKAIGYLKKLQLFVGGLSGLGVIVGVLVGYVFIRRFYASVYFGSFLPFVILLVAQAIFLFSIPVHLAVIYYFSYPKLFVLVSLVNITIVGGLGWVLIPSFGYVGAALAVLVGNVSNFIIPFVWVVAKFKKE